MVDAEDFPGPHGKSVRPFVFCPDETVEGSVYSGVAVEDGDEVFANPLGVPVRRGLAVFGGAVGDGDTVWWGIGLDGGNPCGAVRLGKGPGVEGVGGELNEGLGGGHGERVAASRRGVSIHVHAMRVNSCCVA